MLRQEQRASADSAQRWSVWAYLAFLPLVIAGTLLTRINHWLVVAAIGVPLVVAIALAALGSLDRGLRTPPLLTLACVLAAISASACLSSPYVIMPALLAAFGTAAIGASPAASRRPLTWAAMCLVAAVVPMLLQALDLLPVGFSIANNRLVIEHRVSNASPDVSLAVLVVVTLVTIFAPMAFSYRSARQLRETRARLLLHVWHLRQLTSAV